MFFKNFYQKWGESLEVLKTKNIKLFLLASLNTFIKSIKIFIKYFWWLYLLLIITAVMQNIYGTSNILWLSIFSIISTFVHFYLFLTIRPSVERKDFSYFIQYSGKIWGYLIIPIIISLPLTFILSGIIFSLKLSTQPSTFITLTTLIAGSIIPTCWMGYFFYFDSKNTYSSIFPSIKKAILVLIYYLPFMLIFSLISIILNCFFNKNIVITIMGPIVNGLFISILSVYYTRIKHKDFQLFFKK